MPPQLIVPSIVMSLALVFYSAGVWSERVQRDLARWHVALFWLGLVCDTTATEMMHRLMLAGEKGSLVHTATGIAAIVLMAVHAVWATWVLFLGSREARREFHRYSLAVWMLWLVPYLGGMVAGIMRGTNG
jgi:uncharacterized repeat protein (TIGR03987 family)